MPTYNPNIPQPNDILADSQDDILENFQQLSTAWNINHIPFNNATQGKHTEVTLPENVAPTNTLIDEANIYSQLSTLTGQTELAWQRENNGARIEWTGLLAASVGWTRLPSGILLKWGSATANGATVVTYPVAANTPVFTAVYNTLLQAFSSGTNGADRYILLSPTNYTVLGFECFGGQMTIPANPQNFIFNYITVGI